MTQYDTRCYFNVRAKAYISQLNLWTCSEVTVNSLGNHVVSPEEEKKAAVGRICRKERF